MGSKYLLEFVVSGNAKESLKMIGDGLRQTMNAALEMSEGLEKGGDSLDRLEKMGEFFSLEKIHEQLQEVSVKIGEMVGELLAKSTEMVKDFLHTASEFEDIKSSLKFSFQGDWQTMYDKTYEQAQHLSFTMHQTSDLVANLGKVGINVFGGMGDQMKTFTSKTGEQIGALDVLQDTLVGTGLSMQDSGRLMRGVHEAVVGNFREFKRGLSMPPVLIDEMKKKVSAAGTDMQKSFEGIIQVLGKFYGGATKLKELNLSFQLQQLTDKFELIKNAMAAPGLREVTIGLKSFVDALQRILEDKDALNVLSDFFGVLESSVAWIMKAGAAMVDFARQVMAAAPWLGKLTGYLLVFTIIGGLVLAGILDLSVAVLGLGIAFGFLWTTAMGPFILALPLIVILVGELAAGAAALAGVLGLLAYGGFNAINDNAGKTVSVFEKLEVLFNAFTQLIGSYNGSFSEMTQDTADNLQKMGLLDFVVDVMTYFDRMATAWNEFKDTLSEAGEWISPTFLPMLEEISETFMELMKSLGIITTIQGAGKSSFDTWADAGREFGFAMLLILNNVIAGIRTLVAATEHAIHLFNALNDLRKGNFAQAARDMEGPGLGADIKDIWNQAGQISVGVVEKLNADRERTKLVRETAAPEGVPYGIDGSYNKNFSGPLNEAPIISKLRNFNGPLPADFQGAMDQHAAATGYDVAAAEHAKAMEPHTNRLETAINKLADRPISVSIDGQDLKAKLNDVDTAFVGVY